MMRSVGVIALAVSCSLLSGCDDEFATPSAYDAEPDVCTDAAAREAALSACTATDGCGGIAGYTGTLEGRAIRVGGPLETTRAIDASEGGDVFWDVVEGIGSSPYFNFVLKMESVGGSTAETLTDRTLTTSRAARTAPDPLGDLAVGFELRLSTSAESEAFAATNGGTVALEQQTPNELEGVFTVAFGADELTGCFLLTPQSRRTSAE